MPVTLSACMIVKDEQDLLPQCLGSIVDVVDEIVLIDTGSQDMTMDIARAFGAKIYEHPWEGDFALHRNQAFGYATGEWCLVIDADEELLIPPGKAGKLKENLRKMPAEIGGIVASVREFDRRVNQVNLAWLSIRFFRKSMNPRYEGYIHNASRVDGKMAMTDIIINHYGYHLDAAKMKRKHERTEGMLRRRLEENGEDYKAMYYLVQTLAAQQRFGEALDLSKRCLSLIPITDPGKLQFYGNLYFVMGEMYLRMSNGNAAMACVDKGLGFFPEDLDLNWLKSQVCYAAAMDDEFMKYAAKYTELLAVYRQAMLKGPLKADSLESLPEAIRSNRTISTVSANHALIIANQIAALKKKEEAT
jgi:glycosyltransferase involved in cell wall biosynthesis